ncbi:putative gamma-glutamyltransferase [Necator americanus]|uniref:Putative gamma-glutamyltransferase n=1 Tax=Necator americanus TaxID=51031 RepID=W2TIQ4_NECAM|nr:putative gamma-glutamyltransferase [Necator americanus]ETN81683.1 putative gamma-glutamyltransferase [Necator americanus]
MTYIGAASARNMKLNRTVAIICAILATVFLLSTIALAILVGMKYSEDNVHLEDTLNKLLIEEEYLRNVSQRYENLNANGNNSAADGTPDDGPQQDEQLHIKWPQPSGSLYAHFRKAAVASDHGLCSEIGRDVLIDGGNAVESMIAALLCIGVVNPQSSGIGGGFIMTLYNSSTGRCQTINARESAPLAATEDMFVNDTSQSVYGRANYEVSLKFVMFPSVQFFSCLYKYFTREIFVDKSTGRVYEEGDIIKRERYGFTLQLIANATDPVDLFYKGGMAQTIAGEITENGGHINQKDLASYETLIDEIPLIATGLPGDLEMCGPPPPSSFVVTQSIIAVMAEFYRSGKVDLDDPMVYHRLIEAEKFAYAQRTKLGDVRFVESAKALVANMSTPKYTKWIASMIKDTAQPQEYYLGGDTSQVPDHGTSHVTVIDHDGNAVSCTSTINQLLGAMRASQTLGIIWNDEMDDFSTPGASNAFGFAPSPTNFIAPGKRPMSSMSPMVIYNKNENNVVMVVGASGGSYIISATAQTVIRTMLFNQTVKEAIDAPRLHNQFLPHATEYEKPVPEEMIAVLTNKYKQNMTMVDKQKSVVQGLEVHPDGFIHGNSDFRRKTATYPAGY